MTDLFDTIVSKMDWKWGNFSMLPIFLGMMMASLDVVMMSLAKLSKTGRIAYSTALPSATLIYALEPYIFFKSMKYESLTTMNLIWDLSSDIIVTLVGVFYFKETIKGIRWLAVLFALFSLALFAYTDH